MLKKHKLPFMFLGIGIGIILTSIVYTLYPNVEYKRYSEEEIIEEATDLGMVFIKDSIDTNTDIDEEVTENIEDIDDAEDVVDYPTNEPEMIEFVVRTGDSLPKISKGLYDAGIIDDEISFFNYAREKGVDKILRVGTYNLSANLDYETIIDILMKR